MDYNFNIDCTGDVVTGDTIQFTEFVWSGTYRNPKKIGERTIIAKVIKDSYGEKKQQHTFTLEIISCDGNNSIEHGIRTTRKGRNIYRNGTKRILWSNENDREIVLKEKHERGDMARKNRGYRRKYELSNSF